MITLRADQAQARGRGLANVHAAVLDMIAATQQRKRRRPAARLHARLADRDDTPRAAGAEIDSFISNAVENISGGRSPMLGSAHMSILTAKVAGVGRVAACTRPMNGAAPAATVAAMHVAGANQIYVTGGVRAVAALALATETIPRVTFLTEPRNACVADAQRRLFWEVDRYLTTVTYQNWILAASLLSGEVWARQCGLERFRGRARTCNRRIQTSGTGGRG